MNFMCKTKSSRVLLSITFSDKFWRSHLGILHLSTQHNNEGHYEKIFNLNNTFLLFLGVWPNKLWFKDTGALFGPLYHACTLYHQNKFMKSKYVIIKLKVALY